MNPSARVFRDVWSHRHVRQQQIHNHQDVTCRANSCDAAGHNALDQAHTFSMLSAAMSSEYESFRVNMFNSTPFFMHKAIHRHRPRDYVSEPSKGTKSQWSTRSNGRHELLRLSQRSCCQYIMVLARLSSPVK
jgi:hypothetical protein